MAKKGNRQLISFDCSECKNRNYTSEKNTVLHKDKMAINKYCNHCRKHTLHNEGKVR